VKVTLRLLEVATGQVAATEEAEGARHELFAIQDRLAAAVATALPGAAIASERRRRGTTVEAHECYARARLLIDRISKGSLEDARVLLERAIAIDRHHVEALGALASTYALRSIATASTADVEKALAFADRALAVDPRHVEAHVWRGYALTRLARLAEADAALRQAIDLDPYDSDAHYFAGFAALCGGRRKDALARYQRAVELDSGHGMWWIGLGGTHLCLERRTEALYCFTRAKKLESAPARFATAGAAAYIGEVLRREGRLEEARAEALAGIEAAERSDHAYRDTFRAHGFTVLGSVALQQRDTAAAEVAFQHVIAQAHGRPRVRACGQFVVRALAGLARARTDGVFLDEALRLFDARDRYNFEPFYGGLDDQTLFELALAALALGRRDEAEALQARAREVGSLRPLPPPGADPLVIP
jgi:tetratricopeptide (TPR) repeat protein